MAVRPDLTVALALPAYTRRAIGHGLVYGYGETDVEALSPSWWSTPPAVFMR